MTPELRKKIERLARESPVEGERQAALAALARADAHAAETKNAPPKHNHSIYPFQIVWDVGGVKVGTTSCVNFTITIT
jgi:hypothetical protein